MEEHEKNVASRQQKQKEDKVTLLESKVTNPENAQSGLYEKLPDFFKVGNSFNLNDDERTKQINKSTLAKSHFFNKGSYQQFKAKLESKKGDDLDLDLGETLEDNDSISIYNRE
mmetsp:Transcript_8425/g.14104  ORF Transcript_8425/g.14104 Transcript_8425/m.14104 type:complete len:114 (-) Transcript_8425:547-888(-)